MVLKLMKSGTFWLRYRTPSCSGKYIGFGLMIETGTTIIVDIFRHNPASTRHRIHLKELFKEKFERI